MRNFKLHDGKKGTALTIRVTPRARRTEIVAVLDDGTVRVRISEPPVEGKANAALVKFLAKVLGVKRGQVEIVAGETGLDKLVSVLDLTSKEAQERIEAWIASR